MNMSSLFDWLLQTSAEASVLICALLLLRRILGKRLPPGWRIALWMVIIGKLILPVSFSFMPGLGSFWKSKTQSDSAVVEFIDMGPADEIAPRTSPSVLTPSMAWSMHEILTFIWLAGIVMTLMVTLVRDAAFRRKLRAMRASNDAALDRMISEISNELGLRRVPQVRITEADTVPAVSGLLHSILILPRNWRDLLQGDSMILVLRHELSHLKHHDLWWNWATLLVNAVHWFNPLVWLAAAEFREDRELRCDATALDTCSPQQRMEYGRALLYFQEHFSAPAAMTGLAPFVRNHSALHQRILMITQPTITRPWLHSVIALSLGLLVCAAFGADRPEDDKDANRSRDGEHSRTGPRDGERPRTGPRDEEHPRTGPRDGERPRTGPRDGERPRTGPRDEERPRTGPRDEEKPRANRQKDGERTSDTPAHADSLVLRVVDGGENVIVGDEKVPMNRLRHHLSQTLPNYAGARVTVEADDDIPFKTVGQVLDAARDNGAKGAQIQSTPETKGKD